MRRVTFLLGALLIAGFAYADGPLDNIVDKVRPVPPPGIKVPPEIYNNLKKDVVALGNEIAELRKSLAKKPALLELLPDVQIFYNAVYYALRYDEFLNEKEFLTAKIMLSH